MSSAKARFVRVALPAALLALLGFQNCTGGMSNSTLGGDPGILKAQDSTGSCDNGQPYEGLTCSGQTDAQPTTTSGGGLQQQHGAVYDVICKASTSTSAVEEVRWLAAGADRQVLIILRRGGERREFPALLNTSSGSLSPAVAWTELAKVIRVLQLDDVRARLQLRAPNGALIVESLSCARKK